ncbi:hypothetical protein Tco_1309435 [Tanacetum coccineum]
MFSLRKMMDGGGRGTLGGGDNEEFRYPLVEGDDKRVGDFDLKLGRWGGSVFFCQVNKELFRCYNCEFRFLGWFAWKLEVMPWMLIMVDE